MLRLQLEDITVVHKDLDDGDMSLYIADALTRKDNGVIAEQVKLQ